MGLQRLVSDRWTPLVDWQNAKDDVAVWTAPIHTREKWKELGEKWGSYSPLVYMNDASRYQNHFAFVWFEQCEKVEGSVPEVRPVPPLPDLAKWWVSTVQNTDIMNTRTFDMLNTRVNKLILEVFCLGYSREFAQSLHPWILGYPQQAFK
ncbi:hypothetical protein GJ744_000808 [Endocarpon pusillum]|uniref:Uncharacterized protein n=1 Tax=Endocarpon pusillum TaxID=364733 RepID=A0A8H7E7X4_9EURO|nr:hypothetical protein GJ744_000808 [Endocarpon pusillum]